MWSRSKYVHLNTRSETSIRQQRWSSETIRNFRGEIWFIDLISGSSKENQILSFPGVDLRPNRFSQDLMTTPLVSYRLTMCGQVVVQALHGFQIFSQLDQHPMIIAAVAQAFGTNVTLDLTRD